MEGGSTCTTLLLLLLAVALRLTHSGSCSPQGEVRAICLEPAPWTDPNVHTCTEKFSVCRESSGADCSSCMGRAGAPWVGTRGTDLCAPGDVREAEHAVVSREKILVNLIVGATI